MTFHIVPLDVTSKFVDPFVVHFPPAILMSGGMLFLAVDRIPVRNWLLETRAFVLIFPTARPLLSFPSGIGLATAVAFAKQGARLVLAAGGREAQERTASV